MPPGTDFGVVGQVTRRSLCARRQAASHVAVNSVSPARSCKLTRRSHTQRYFAELLRMHVQTSTCADGFFVFVCYFDDCVRLCSGRYLVSLRFLRGSVAAIGKLDTPNSATAFVLHRVFFCCIGDGIPSFVWISTEPSGRAATGPGAAERSW